MRILILVAAILLSSCASIVGDGQDLPSSPTPHSGPAEAPTATFAEAFWQARIDAAFAASDCPPVPEPAYDGPNYAGPLIDTHFHVPAIPDSAPGSSGGDYEGGFPHLGVNATIPQIVCTLEHEGTDRVFAFFPVYHPIRQQLLDIARRMMDEYPGRFVPFIMPPGEDVGTVAAGDIEEMIAVYPGLFVGYGEIGLYGTEPGAGNDWPPNGPIFREIYPLVREHKLIVYFHPGEGHAEILEQVLAEHPDIKFIVHGEQVEEQIGELMGRFPNIFFTVNDLYGDQYLLHQGENTRSFLAALEDVEPLLERDVAKWKDLIEAHPDQFLWGTDRGGPAAWTFDRAVGQALADYGRAFISRLEPAVQEKFAYKNAEGLFE
ncbi:MAG: amidohydrolase family protein [Chloroflexi bacterium]|nr:amidohydrolase family protein [Chloroflexota bacterium]